MTPSIYIGSFEPINCREPLSVFFTTHSGACFEMGITPKSIRTEKFEKLKRGAENCLSDIFEKKLEKMSNYSEYGSVSSERGIPAKKNSRPFFCVGVKNSKNQRWLRKTAQVHLSPLPIKETGSSRRFRLCMLTTNVDWRATFIRGRNCVATHDPETEI